MLTYRQHGEKGKNMSDIINILCCWYGIIVGCRVIVGIGCAFGYFMYLYLISKEEKEN